MRVAGDDNDADDDYKVKHDGDMALDEIIIMQWQIYLRLPLRPVHDFAVWWVFLLFGACELS